MATAAIIRFSSRNAIGSNYGFLRIFKFLLIKKLYEKKYESDLVG